MFKYIFLVLSLFLIFSKLNAQITTGNHFLIEGSGVLYRDNKPRPIPKTKIIIKDKDLIQTKKNGKIKILLLGGDEIFLAPNSEIKFEEKVKIVGLAKKINRNFNLSGKEIIIDPGTNFNSGSNYSIKIFKKSLSQGYELQDENGKQLEMEYEINFST